MARHNFSKTDTEHNGLRAAVLGANDGIVSIAGLVIGIAGAQQSKLAILTAGLAGIVAGAMSIAAGEYVSVCAERDFEEAMLKQERRDLREHPQDELRDLEEAYEDDGLGKKEALDIAKEMTKANAFKVHADVDLHIDPAHLTSPWSSVLASSGSFILGSVVPLIAVMIPAGRYYVGVTFLSVLIALTVTGVISARASGTAVFKPVARVVIGGAIAMTVTYVIGNVFHIIGA